MGSETEVASPATGRTVVVALGGNAIARFDDDGTIASQYRRASEAMSHVADLIGSGVRLALTHGNGPVVGNIMLRGEAARGAIPPTPLFIADADSEGGIGLMLQQTLGNELRARGLTTAVATVVTQTVVDAEDPAFSAPTKPIGPYYDADRALELASETGWSFAEEPGRGWRRVVASPRPMRIVESEAVCALLDAGVIPIAAGGGGVPVTETDGVLTGIDAVVDKDWSAAVLARDVGAASLVILMEADAVYDAYATSNERRIEHIGADEAAGLASTLPPGSVGPKLAACAWFAARGGTAVICRAEDVMEALSGRAGTTVSPA